MPVGHRMIVAFILRGVVVAVMGAGQLPHLETFSAAAETGSFTAAARTLGLTQAAVSQRIQAVETLVGLPLFDRKGGHIVLTEAGHRLYEYAQRILELHREALADLSGQEAPMSGELALAASSVPGEHLLPSLLSVFRKRYPYVKVRAAVTDTHEVVDCVERGKAHLGLVGGKCDNPHLEFRRFAGDRLVLIVPARHRWKRRKTVSVDELCDQPLIVREAGSASRWCVERALEAVGKSPRDLQIALELGSNEAIKEAVLRGLGLAVLSTHAIQNELKTRKLHALQVTNLALQREMFVAWDRRRAIPIFARLFLDLIEARKNQDRLDGDFVDLI
jgi:LysR family transcriptional regulator, low CO2-responsive transcriptional regulator